MSAPGTPESLVVEQLPDIYFNQALESARAGQLAQARDHLLAVLALEPEMLDAQILLGKVQAQLGDYAKAIECWESALRIAPDHEGAMAAIGKAKEILGRQSRNVGMRRLSLVGAVVAVFILGILAVTTYDAVASRLNPPQPPLGKVREGILGIGAVYVDGIEVSANGGTIRIGGSVDTEEQKLLVAAVAESRSEGFPVDISGIKVDHPDSLADSLRGLLGKVESGRFREIQVTQEGSILRLAGLVSSEADKRQLEELAHTLVGVREVDATQLHTEEPAICVLQAGETLWELAERFYGDARLWTVIRDANAQWRDPRRIPAGTQLVVPSGEMGAVQETKDERGEG